MSKGGKEVGRRDQQGSHCILNLGVNLFYYLICVPPMYNMIYCIETLFNFWSTRQILRGKKNSLQRVNGNADQGV